MGRHLVTAVLGVSATQPGLGRGSVTRSCAPCAFRCARFFKARVPVMTATVVAARRCVKLIVSATLSKDPSKLQRLALHCPRYIAASAEDHRYHLPSTLQVRAPCLAANRSNVASPSSPSWSSTPVVSVSKWPGLPPSQQGPNAFANVRFPSVPV